MTGIFAFLDREFIKKFSAIALPVALMNLINFGVKAVDTLMLGLVGEVQLSGAAVANQLSFMFMIFSGGVASGCGVIASQYWGAGEKERVREIFAFMYKAMVAMNLAFAAVAFFAPYFVIGIITTDREVIAQGAIYVRIMSFGYLVWGFTSASTIALRSVGVVKISVAVFSVSLVISATLNYLLIFGNFGFPQLGIAGAAIATVTARFVEFIIITAYILKVDKELAFRLSNLLGRTRGVGKGFMRHGFPVLMNEVFWASGFFIVNVIIGRIGREFVAANAIGGLLFQFSGMILFSCASAASVIVGNTIGEGHYDKARQITKGMVALNFLTGIFLLIIIQLIRVPFVNFYELSDTARAYAFQLTNIISVLVIFMAVADGTLMGPLRGGGDAKFVMIADVVFMWMISIPLGAVTGLILGWPVWIVFIILRIDSFFKTMLVLWRVPSGKWLKDVTKG
ncbi:MAG: MATE family efflux transporter [Defluviitaleaceae bacterium]|nr:MATE family efflux transporter [Defluviitaleaceae bacterium]